MVDIAVNVANINHSLKAMHTKVDSSEMTEDEKQFYQRLLLVTAAEAREISLKYQDLMKAFAKVMSGEKL